MKSTNPKDLDCGFWIAAAAATGGAGLSAIDVSFVATLAPSARALAGHLQGLKGGELRTVEWRGQPVFVLQRSNAL